VDAAMKLPDDASAAYGTFHGGAQRPTTASSTTPARSTRPWLRVLGVAGAIAAAASVAISATSTLSTLTAPSSLSAAASTRADAVDHEKIFLDGVDRAKLREYLHAYASKPHPVGTTQDYATAVYTKQMFESFGIAAEIKTYYTLLSTPRRAARVAITAPAPHARELNLTEASVAGDICTTNPDATPPYLAYSRSGNLTAPVVYVNYGRPEDFEWLVAQGVELKGKIALARYGGNYRGLKVLMAEQHGMAGTLIYSDPQDDGYGVGAAYPNGPWRPKDSFQRGSIENPSLYSGDPLTPGYAALKDAPRIPIDDANVPHTLATVLSYEQATYILESLRGKKAPTAWQGGLELANGGYYVGDDGTTQVHMDLDVDTSVGPIWDVIGTIEGSEEPDQYVLIGNHRDAWVCGAIDPSSGSSTMLEIARNYGNLLKSGWRPRRTIKLASWDGEELSLLGSTEYAEEHKEELLQKAVVYINVDLTYGSMVAASSTPSIAKFLYETAKAIPANQFVGNETDASLYAQWVAQYDVARAASPAMDKLTLAPEHLISFLGAGSDYTVFYVHLGVPSADISFKYSTGASYGTYHSTMDSPMYLETAADPHYTTQATTAKWWGLLTLKFAMLPVVPFDFSTYGIAMHKDLSNLEEQTKALKLALDYAELRKSIDHFIDKASNFTALAYAVAAKYAEGETSVPKTDVLNAKLIGLERQFLADEGLPHRPWFRHVIFGPGFYEGYAGAAFPGIADGILFKDNATTMQAHIGDVAKIVTKAADFLTLA
jgi:N-acetylated-alpha-linked acidic dipeptidase